MKKLCRIAFAASILATGWSCSAQSPSVPFGQIERDAQTHQNLALNDDYASGSSSSAAAAASSSSGGISSRPAASQRTMDSRYFILNGLHLGTATLDVAFTRHCIANHTCREGNPLMPSSALGQVGIDLTLVGYSSWLSYRLKKHHSNLWWMAPTIGSTAHAVGVATGISHF
jgi:hypothetical protein